MKSRTGRQVGKKDIVGNNQDIFVDQSQASQIC